MPLYTAMIGALLLHDEPLRARLMLGVPIALGGLTLAFSRAWTPRGGPGRGWSLAVVPSPSGADQQHSTGCATAAAGRRLVNACGMLAGGSCRLIASASGERWGSSSGAAIRRLDPLPGDLESAIPVRRPDGAAGAT